MQITLNKETIVRALPLLATTILFLIFLINDPHWFWVEAWFLLEIVLLTSITRTLSLKDGAVALLGGITLGFGVVFIIGSIFDAVGMLSGTRAFLMPPIEEVVKLLPVLVIITLYGTLKRPRLNLSDFMFLGACAGSGFSMLEKYFWDSVYFPFTYGPHIGNVYLFPDALGVYAGGGQFGYIGHAAASLFVALGLGITFMMLVKKRHYWLVPVLITFAWVSIEHIILNYYYTPGGDAFMAFSGGMWTPWIILIAVFIALRVDIVRANRLLMTNEKLRQKLFHALKHMKDYPSFKRAWSLIRSVNYLAWVKNS